MAPFVYIHDMEFLPIVHKGQIYYVGEETVLDYDQKELGYISTRGGYGVIVAFAPDGIREAGRQRLTPNDKVTIETEHDLIDALLALQARTTTPYGDPRSHKFRN